MNGTRLVATLGYQLMSGLRWANLAMTRMYRPQIEEYVELQRSSPVIAKEWTWDSHLSPCTCDSGCVVLPRSLLAGCGGLFFARAHGTRLVLEEPQYSVFCPVWSADGRLSTAAVSE